MNTNTPLHTLRDKEEEGVVNEKDNNIKDKNSMDWPLIGVVHSTFQLEGEQRDQFVRWLEAKSKERS